MRSTRSDGSLWRTGCDHHHQLNFIKYIHEVKTYTYESELYDLIKNGNFSVRFLGDDYKNKSYTGDDLNITVYFLNRDHGWSTTKFKNLIAKSVRDVEKN